MRQSVFFAIILTIAVGISIAVFQFLPEHIKRGGPLVMLLITLSILAIAFIIERYITLKRAEGRGSLHGFVRAFREAMAGGRVQQAVELCEKQSGALANVCRMGLLSYLGTRDSDMTVYEKQDITRRAIDEANMLEAPLLERNLIALSTIASIATMVGLLGTTIGMIRAFKAMATTGAPDAIQLALGISEALVNTAGGLMVAIVAIVAYNFFVNKVDTLNYMTDEAAHEMLDQIHTMTEGGKRAKA
jgi:biopolymer transport protein ExbB